MNGCDYLPGGLPQLGLKRATVAVKKYVDDLRNFDEFELRKLLKNLNSPEEKIENFIEAERTFLHQNVWDARESVVRPLNPPPPRSLA